LKRVSTDGFAAAWRDLSRKTSEKMSATDPPTSVHRALADPRRVSIVEELRANPDGLDAHELARRLGLHPNTIRWHLGILADARIVTSHAGDRTTPGRPRILYTISEDADTAEHENYRLLATILTGTLSKIEDGARRAEEAGRAWGRYLVNSPPPHLRTSDAQATQEIVDLLDQHGFRPETATAEGQIRMRRCPFRELAETDPGIVCAVHLGLIAGAFAELRSSLEIERLDAFVEPGLCIAQLRSKSKRGDEQHAGP
jgi:predicted ArsR family transcriptional regulator